MARTDHAAGPVGDGTGHDLGPDPVRLWPPLWSRAQWLRLDWWRRSQRRPPQRLWWDPAVDSLCDALVQLPRSSRLIVEAHADEAVATLVIALGAARAQARITAQETVEDLEDLWQAYAAEPAPIALVAAVLRGWTSVPQRVEGPR